MARSLLLALGLLLEFLIGQAAAHPEPLRYRGGRHRPVPPPPSPHYSAWANGAYQPVPCRGGGGHYTCYRINVRFDVRYANATFFPTRVFNGFMLDEPSGATTVVGTMAGMLTTAGPQPDNSSLVYTYDNIAFAFGELNIIYVATLDNNKNLGEFNRAIVGGTGYFEGATGSYNRVQANGGATSELRVFVPSLPKL